jgi:hypothetical protein
VISNPFSPAWFLGTQPINTSASWGFVIIKGAECNLQVLNELCQNGNPILSVANLSAYLPVSYFTIIKKLLFLISISLLQHLILHSNIINTQHYVHSLHKIVLEFGWEPNQGCSI